jgi:uncharacterized RDD family membrane protein YckC
MTASSVRDLGLEGAHAGVATRATAFVIDVVVIVGAFAVGSSVVERILSLFLGRDISLANSQFVSTVAFVVWAVFALAYPLAVAGRTLGMTVLGLRAVRPDGSDLGAGRALARVVAFPLSFLVCGVGFLLIALRRDHRALHDLIAGSAVVYSWNARAGRLRFLMRPAPPAA